MEITKLISQITSFIKYLNSKSTALSTLLQNLEKNVNTVQDQLEVLSEIRNATIPKDMVKKYPDVKDRVLANLLSFIDEEISEISHLLKQLEEVTLELRKLYQKIEKYMTQIDWKEYSDYLTGFTEIAEWGEKCWKYFYLVHLNIKNGIRLLHADDTHSKACLKTHFTVDNINKEYLFNSPIINLFQLLKTDLTSRNKIQVNSFKLTWKSA